MMKTVSKHGSSIALIGFMGCGKTSVAKCISRKIKLKYIDTDDEVSLAAQMSILHIFERYGESFFRELETEAVRRVSLMNDCVIATGGGIIKNEVNIQYLKMAGEVIYLNASAEQLYNNVSRNQDVNRPLLNVPGDKLTRIKSLLAEREPLYMQYSDYQADVTGLSIEETADLVIAHYNQMRS